MVFKILGWFWGAPEFQVVGLRQSVGGLALGMARALRLQYLHIFNWIWGNFAVLQHSGFDRPQLCHVLQPDSFSPAQG